MLGLCMCNYFAFNVKVYLCSCICIFVHRTYVGIVYFNIYIFFICVCVYVMHVCKYAYIMYLSVCGPS